MFNYKNLLPCIILGAVSFNAVAMNLPSMSHSSGYDEIRTSDGMTCRSSMHGAQLQIGALAGDGTDNNGYHYETNFGHQQRERDEKGVYIQLSIPIGGPDRVDCSKLYELELKRKQLELQQLEAQIQEAQARAKLLGADLPSLD
ncbi:MAG: hypothetical protein ACRC2Y_04415 [Aeromonas veronii]